MLLSREQRLRIATHAAELMRLDTIEWVRSHWLVPVDNKKMDVGCKGTMSRVRGKISILGLGNSCGVCLEGALLLAMAQDSEIYDGWDARLLVKEFTDDVRQLELDAWDVTDYESLAIPELNDDYLSNKQDAINVLDMLVVSLAQEP